LLIQTSDLGGKTLLDQPRFAAGLVGESLLDGAVDSIVKTRHTGEHRWLQGLAIGNEL